jgi:hypothetical protein
MLMLQLTEMPTDLLSNIVWFCIQDIGSPEKDLSSAQNYINLMRVCKTFHKLFKEVDSDLEKAGLLLKTLVSGGKTIKELIPKEGASLQSKLIDLALKDLKIRHNPRFGYILANIIGRSIDITTVALVTAFCISPASTTFTINDATIVATALLALARTSFSFGSVGCGKKWRDHRFNNALLWLFSPEIKLFNKIKAPQISYHKLLKLEIFGCSNLEEKYKGHIKDLTLLWKNIEEKIYAVTLQGAIGQYEILQELIEIFKQKVIEIEQFIKAEISSQIPSNDYQENIDLEAGERQRLLG